MFEKKKIEECEKELQTSLGKSGMYWLMTYVKGSHNETKVKQRYI